MNRSRIVVGVVRTLDSRFVLVEQYRRPVKHRTLEFPAGHVEPGEDDAAAMARELGEETGYEALEVRRLGSFFTVPHLTEEIAQVYECVVGREPSIAESDLDSDEVELETVILSRPGVVEAIRTGHLRDAKSIAAWYMFCTLPKVL